MTYKTDLEANYAAIRKRMYGGTKPVVRIALQAVHQAELEAANNAVPKDIGSLGVPTLVGGVAAPTGVSMPTSEAVRLGFNTGPNMRENYINVLKWVSKKHGIAPAVIQSGLRERRVIEARHELWWLVKFHLGYSFPRIAKLALRDHSTVIHGITKHSSRLDSYKAELQVA